MSHRHENRLPVTESRSPFYFSGVRHSVLSIGCEYSAYICRFGYSLCFISGLNLNLSKLIQLNSCRAFKLWKFILNSMKQCDVVFFCSLSASSIWPYIRQRIFSLRPSNWAQSYLIINKLCHFCVFLLLYKIVLPINLCNIYFLSLCI